MGYVLYAILAANALMTARPPWAEASRVVPLEQGVSMIPITDELHDSFSSEAVVTAHGWPEFTLLPGRLADVLRSLSEHGTVAYVEAEYFGGPGEQRCVVWRNGDTLLKPMEQEGAINQALRLLGVRKKPFIDEFDSVGLGRHRSTEDWVTDASAPSI